MGTNTPGRVVEAERIRRINDPKLICAENNGD